MTINNLPISFGLLFLCLAEICFAGQPEQLANGSEISKILSAIPVTDKEMAYRNIGERLKNVGMIVTGISVYRIASKSDIESSDDRIGDIIYEIYTSNPSSVLTQHYCDMLGSPSYRKRGNRFIPQDRTAVWLMTSKCESPK